MPSRILVTGGNGQLAHELTRIDPAILAPTRQEMDFSVYEQIEQYCAEKVPAIIIHAGAVTNKFAEDADEGYIRSNIIGTANIALWCKRHNARLIYISSDYVYPGEVGDYTEESVLYPVNRYAASKLGGELSVRLHDNSLIIRTSFYSSLNFSEACTDQFTSRIPLRTAAGVIYKLALMDDVRGIMNVGSATKRSLYDIVKKEFNPDAKSRTRKDFHLSYPLPRDSSMNTRRLTNQFQDAGMSSKTQTSCRFCRTPGLHTYLHLGSTPLANSYLKEEALALPEFREELALQLCSSCGLSQLTKVVHPDLMFKNYLYVSSTTETFRSHCAEMARTTTALAHCAAGDLVLDIASNDGCLLSKYQEIGMNVLGVDPAENLAQEANAAGIRTLNAYWSSALAKDIAARFGKPKVITATNVFAHVDDVHDFVEAVDTCMAQRGIFVIECPYVLDFLEKNEFDTAYHEHLSYIGITPLVRLMTMHNLQVFDVEYFKDLHGGTIRVYVSRIPDYPCSPRVGEYVEREAAFGLGRRDVYDDFARRILRSKNQLLALIERERAKGKIIWAYGASAKGNTLVNFFGIDNASVPVVIDDNPKKWGYFTPGARMRITSINELATAKVDYLLLLAWNFQKEIMARCEAASYAGAYIVPVPEPTIVTAYKAYNQEGPRT
jgi:dTDP-4-dehydrorhamnose reductase